MSAVHPLDASLCRYPTCRAIAEIRLLWPDLHSTDHCREHARAVWRGVEFERFRPVGLALIEIGPDEPDASPFDVPRPAGQGVLL